MPVRMGLAKFEQIEGGFILCWVSQSFAKFSRGGETRNTERRQDHHEWARRFTAESENSERSWWERVDSIAVGRICYYQQQFGHVWQYDKLNVGFNYRIRILKNNTYFGDLLRFLIGFDQYKLRTNSTLNSTNSTTTIGEQFKCAKHFFLLFRTKLTL